MSLKKILKMGLQSMGYDIVKFCKLQSGPAAVEPEKEEVQEVAEDLNEKRLLYYQEEGKRFEWIREYDFKTIIDVGANEGQFAGKILSVFPDAALHCFEPLPTVYDQLREYFGNYPNVFLYNFGLGNENGEKSIFKNEYSPSSSLLEMLELHKSNFDFAREVIVEKILVRRLDEFFSEELQRPLLLKIDVQGYEKYVLEGGEEVVQQADVIIIETSYYPMYKDQPLFDDIYFTLTKLGFQFAGNIEQLISPVDNKILQADSLFIRNRGSHAK